MWGKYQMGYIKYLELLLWVAYVEAIINAGIDLEFLFKAGNIFEYGQFTFREEKWKTQTHSPFIRLVSSKRGEAQNENYQFIGVLEAVNKLHTSDPRDYIFALLGNPLARKQNGEMIVDPDYNKTVDEIYLEFAVALLDMPTEGKILFSCVGYYSQEHLENRSGLSWVPYWNKRGTQCPVGLYAPDSNTGGQSFDEFKYHLRISGKRVNGLDLSVYVTDQVSWVSQQIAGVNLTFAQDYWGGDHLLSKRSYVDVLLDECLEARGADGMSPSEIEHIFACTLKMGWYGRIGGNVPIEQQQLQYQAYKVAMQRIAQSGIESVKTEEANPLDYAIRINRCNGRKLAWTMNHKLCLVPGITRPTDVCVLIPGLPVPFIIRPTEQPNHYLLIGDCYIYGIMDGELFDELREKGDPEQWIILE
jgi:hypothetical protein